MTRKRDIEQITVPLPNGVELRFSSGEHNILQKKIIEDFLPRFGNGCSILYIGDTAHKLLYVDEENLRRLSLLQNPIGFARGFAVSRPTGSKRAFLSGCSCKTEVLQEPRLNFFELSHDELPDIIAYDFSNNWLFLIEAVHSAGSMSEIRVHELKNLLKKCTSDLIFVTAFLKRDDFRKWSTDIAWETEVWIADNPDHLIHFNGSKFLGSYKNKE